MVPHGSFDGTLGTDMTSLLARCRSKHKTFWLTGLSGSGKSTIAYALEKRLVDFGIACLVLDGDAVRRGLSKDLGFSAYDRSENIRRVAEVSRIANDSGIISIVALISPYALDRAEAERVIGQDRFIEVFVDTPLVVCEQRDVKGLYRKARAGEIPQFTGVSSVYEPPINADYKVDTSSRDLASIVLDLSHLCPLMRGVV